MLAVFGVYAVRPHVEAGELLADAGDVTEDVGVADEAAAPEPMPLAVEQKLDELADERAQLDEILPAEAPRLAPASIPPGVPAPSRMDDGDSDPDRLQWEAPPPAMGQE